MNGWGWFFLIFFGIGAIIPGFLAFWAGVRKPEGYWGYWPCALGSTFALLLGIFTIIAMVTNWGGCPARGGSTGSAEGAVSCATGDKKLDCKPDVWRVECNQPGKCGTVPPSAFCPAGQKPVFPFCERIQHGGVKQPSATWSDVSFVAAGLWLLWLLHFYYRPNQRPDDDRNPMKEIGWLSVTYGFIVIFMGPASMWFHSSMKEWAGWFDSMSVIIWLSFNASYVFCALLFQMWGKSRGVWRTRGVLIGWLGTIIPLGLLGIKPGLTLVGYFVSGGFWGIFELSYLGHLLSSRATHTRKVWLIVVNIVLLGATMFLWSKFHHGIASATDCQSREGFPGHALFHIMAAFSTVLTYLSFASERKVMEKPTTR